MPIAVIEVPDVLALEHLDYVGDAVVSDWRNQQMDMAEYQNIGTQDTIVPFVGLIEFLQKESTVFGGKKDRLAVVPADG